MAEPSTLRTPTIAPDLDAYLERFAWHPEPELIGYRDEAASRAALENLGAATWHEALEFLYGIAVERAMGDASPYEEARRRYYASDPTGPRDGPGPAPVEPMRAADVLGEFSARLAGGLMNAQHPRQFGYFTPPPLPMSIMGELLDAGRQPGRRRLARRSVRRVRRGGGRPVAVRPRRLRRGIIRVADQRRGHGQLHGDGARPRPAPRADPGSRRPAARWAARRRPGLHQRPDPFLDRARPRRARVPARDAGRPAVGRRLPPAWRTGRRGRQRAIAQMA